MFGSQPILADVTKCLNHRAADASSGRHVLRGGLLQANFAIAEFHATGSPFG